jgi:hypothetical protein
MARVCDEPDERCCFVRGRDTNRPKAFCVAALVYRCVSGYTNVIWFADSKRSRRSLSNRAAVFSLAIPAWWATNLAHFIATRKAYRVVTVRRLAPFFRKAASGAGERRLMRLDGARCSVCRAVRNARILVDVIQKAGSLGDDAGTKAMPDLRHAVVLGQRHAPAVHAAK